MWCVLPGSAMRSTHAACPVPSTGTAPQPAVALSLPSWNATVPPRSAPVTVAVIVYSAPAGTELAGVDTVVDDALSAPTFWLSGIAADGFQYWLLATLPP